MRELIKKVEIEQHDIDYLQFTSFDVERFKFILNDILVIKNPKYTYSEENYKHFMEEYREAFMKHRITINTILNKYAPEYNNAEHEFNFVFEQGLLEIYKRNIVEGGNCCGNYKK